MTVVWRTHERELIYENKTNGQPVGRVSKWEHNHVLGIHADFVNIRGELVVLSLKDVSLVPYVSI